MDKSQHIVADWTWTGTEFEAGVTIEVNPAGRISEVHRKPPGTEALRLDGQALLPGFVNAHSHAFQRGLRGLGERFPGHTGNFWSWREAMYGLVQRLTRTELYRLSRQAFEEMRAAGITTVGEFHYVHHDDPLALDFAFDEAILEAADDANIRLTLLEVYYRTGGIREALGPAQARFSTPSLPAYWKQLDALERALRPADQTLGVVAHSIRAADPGEIAELRAEAVRRGMVMHMHAEEPRAEIEASLAAYGRTPLEILTQSVGAGEEFTAIHCTHSSDENLDAYLARGSRICLCPITEANLGDGIARLPRMLSRSEALCLGTDGNSRISMLEEIRWLEYVQRLAREKRGAAVDASGQCARKLLDIATHQGAASLGLPTGRVKVDHWADFVTVDLHHPTLAGWAPETLLESLLLGTGNEVIRSTAVGGEWREHRSPTTPRA